MRRNARLVLVVVLLGVGVVLVGPVRPVVGEPAPESGSSDWRQVSIGAQHVCGIRTSGRLFCWGADNFGQLGNGGADLDRSTPGEVAGGETDWRSVSAGGNHTCAIRTTGRLYCWGNDASGELGNGAVLTVEQDTPVQVAGGATNWATVSSGSFHTCATRATGRLFCWGTDGFGRLGNGNEAGSQPAPFEVAGRATTWTAVSAGLNHTCGRRSTGRLSCWGYDNNGQLGDDEPLVTRQSPRLVAGGATNWTAVTAGGAHTCGRRSTGRIFCWGDDFTGQVGDGGGFDPSVGTPVQVAGGATTWTSVTAGGSHTCGRRSTGRLYCWGSNGTGQLGTGAAPDAATTAPAQVAGGATDWVIVDAGDSNACARIATNRLFCWGDDDNGQLGDGGTDTDQARPSDVFA